MTISDEAKKLIEQEESVHSDVHKKLLAQRDTESIRLQHESERARDLTSQIVAARRDVDRQMLASDEAVSHQLRDLKRAELKDIDKLLDSPYFARLEVEEDDGKRKIEYKLGTTSNTDCRIIDWRKAPIAKLYYEYKEGDEYFEDIQGRERNGRVTLRNKVDIKKGRLKALNCRYGGFVKKDNEWELSSKHASSLTGENKGRLPDVLALITPEQFKAITEDATSAVIISGVAGSGKTTIALYRLAWLLHEDNSNLQEDEVLVIVKSTSLKKFIEASLPILNITVKVNTLDDWLEAQLKGIYGKTVPRITFSQNRSIDRLKSSLAFISSLEDYIKSQNKKVVAYLQKELSWETLPLHIKKVFEELTKKEVPSIALVNNLISVLNAAKGDATGTEKSLQTLLYTKERLGNYCDDILRILKSPDEIIARDETKLLDKTLISAALDDTNKNFSENTLNYFDIPAIIRLYELKQGPLTLENQKPLRHLLLDEVQDYSPVELACTLGAIKNIKDVTLSGDTEQEIGDTSFPGWEKLKRVWKLEETSKFVSLSISHRSTFSIMKLADYISGKQRTTGGKEGKPPLWLHCPSEEYGVRKAIAWLEKVITKHPDSIVAVICKDSQEAKYVDSLLTPTFQNIVRLGDESQFSFEEGILVTEVKLVKGLEFASVLIWNPSATHYPDNRIGRNKLYTAITRTEKNLAIVSWEKKNPILPSINSKLVRGIDYTILEEEEKEKREEEN